MLQYLFGPRLAIARLSMVQCIKLLIKRYTLAKSVE